MLLRRTYRFKLEPNQQQIHKLSQLSGARRFVYNWALERRKEHFEATGKSLSGAALCLELTQLKKQEATLWLREADSQVLQQAVKDVDKAFCNFFSKRARFPRFHSKNKGHFSFRLPQRVKVASGKVYCPKIGWIRLRQSQAIDGETKSATFKRDACGGWFVTLVSEFLRPEVALPEAHNPVGIDMGLKDFVTLSNGESTPAPRLFRKLEKKLGQAQKRLCRAKKGSKRRQKARLKVAKVHRKIANSRADFVHKVSSGLVKRFDHIGIEDLNVKGMSKNHRLSKSVLDAALGELRRQLEYKAIWNRVRLVKVSRWFPSSKMCGSCGALNDTLTLSERTWPCACGADNHRDINAARNICKESLAVGHTERLNAHRESVSRATARSFR